MNTEQLWRWVVNVYLVPGAELHAIDAGGPLLHHAPCCQSIASTPAVLPVLQTIVILQ